MSYLMDFHKFVSSVRTGALGKTAQLWISYTDHIWLVLSLIMAVKSNYFKLYKCCLFKMCDLSFAFNGQNYARYLTFFSVNMANIEKNYPRSEVLLKRGAISVLRSFIPGNRYAVDKTIEETFMKSAKSRSGMGSGGTGLTRITTNYNACQRWVRTLHQRTLYTNATFHMADMLTESNEEDKHKDMRPSEIRRSERNVKSTIGAIESF